MSVVLQKLPENIDIEDMIAKASALFEQYPPQSLPFRTWAKVSDTSVLKTTMDVKALAIQTLEEGQILFEKHAEQIRRDEARQRMLLTVKKTLSKYQRPVVLTISVAICVIAILVGKDKNTTIGATLQRLFNVSNLGRFVGFTGGREL